MFPFLLLAACDSPAPNDASVEADGAIRVDAPLPDASDAGPIVVPAGEWVGTPPGPSLGQGEPPVVLWPRPAHAHPEVPFTFTFVVFDPENEALRYALEGAPTGMTVDDHGTVHWTTPVAGTYAITLRVDDGRADAVTVPFTLEVDDSHFLFVALDGNDAGRGTFDDPLADIEVALARIRELGWGTVFVRGGTYATPWQWEAPGMPSPIRGADGTADHPYALRGYPGETVVLDCGGAGVGPWSFGASYWLFTDLEVRNASRGETGGMVLETFSLAQNVTVRDSNWDRSTNCTGFLIRGEEAICHRCVGIDNFDRASDHWNSSNFLVYLDGDGARGTRYILDSYSSGSIVGFKVKHAGTARLLVHASRSEDDDIGVAVADDGSEVRYSSVVRAGTGLFLGMADPNEHTRGEVTFHHDTVIDSGHAFSVQHTYADRDAVRAHHLVLSSSMALGATEDARHLMFVWPYADAPPTTLQMDENCYAAPSFDAGFRFGRAEGSLEAWRAHGVDGASVSTAPIAFEDDLHLPSGSPCEGMGALP